MSGMKECEWELVKRSLSSTPSLPCILKLPTQLQSPLLLLSKLTAEVHITYIWFQLSRDSFVAPSLPRLLFLSVTLMRVKSQPQVSRGTVRRVGENKNCRAGKRRQQGRKKEDTEMSLSMKVTWHDGWGRVTWSTPSEFAEDRTRKGEREERKTDYQNTLIMLMPFSPLNVGIVCLSVNMWRFTVTCHGAYLLLFL